MHDAAVGASLPLPDEGFFACHSVRRHAFGYVVALAGRSSGGACPKCGVVSVRVHSRFERRVRDLPIQGERVLVRLACRKFVCGNTRCRQRIFCERFGTALPAFARMTARLEATLAALSLATSANLAARLARVLGMAGSSSTLLRAAHRFVPATPFAPEIAVDDFAFRRGHRYGTLIVDHATRKPIELLRDRSQEALVAYLEAHPEVTLVSRDRDLRYAEAIRLAAPDATVVVDRWHLIRNIADAFERQVARAQRDWRVALHAALEAEHAARDPSDREPVVPEPPLPRPRRVSTPSSGKLETQAARRRERQRVFDEAHRLRKDGWAIHRIARHLNLERVTIKTYLGRDAPPDWSRRGPTPRPLDAHHDLLAERWQAGCRSANLLHEHVRAVGYTGSLKSVQRYVRGWRAATAEPATPASSALAPFPPPRALAWRMLQDAPDRTTRALLRLVPDAAHHTALARAGIDAIRNPNPSMWSAWTAAIRDGPPTPMRAFVIGCDRDQHAIIAALTLPHSNGPAEGNVNRLKLIKRATYGRAGFDLLRKKVLHQLS